MIRPYQLLAVFVAVFVAVTIVLLLAGITEGPR
jgi:hypothetical protein